jgi:hypothetical protein
VKPAALWRRIEEIAIILTLAVLSAAKGKKSSAAQ